MRLLDVSRTMLRDLLVDRMDVEDVLMHAVVLHTHSIVLRRDVALEDVASAERIGGHLVLAPLTRRSLAELIAERWSADPHRGNAGYWLARYSADAPYELFADVSNAHRARALAAQASIRAHPLVAWLIPE